MINRQNRCYNLQTQRLHALIEIPVMLRPMRSVAVQLSSFGPCQSHRQGLQRVSRLPDCPQHGCSAEAELAEGLQALWLHACAATCIL